MATQDQHDGDKAASATPAQPAALTARGASRRRFAKAASGGAGVILTLTSQPGMATAVCAAPSQSLSLTHSAKPGQVVACAGVSPGYWKNHDGWPAGVDKTNAMFTSFYSCTYAREYSSKTVYDVLTPPNAYDNQNLGCHMAATYLNVLAGYISFLTVQDLRNIWNEITRTGVYKPSAGVVWQAYDLVVYLKKTMS